MKVGDRVKGFKFNNDDYPDIGYVEEMNEFIGKEGKIHYIDDDVIEVEFKNFEFWDYPKELAKDFLIK